MEPLLTTRVSVPPLRSGLVSRRRLIEALNQLIGGRLLLLSAPAGFSNTILLTQWSAQSHWQVAWVSLETSDNDPIRFWRHLIAALDVAAPGAGQEGLDLLQGRQSLPIEAMLISLLNRLAFLLEDLALILDDYHLISTLLSYGSQQEEIEAMKLAEALSGNALAGAARSDSGNWAIIHRSRGGYHLTRHTPDAQGQSQSQTWLFPNLYDLLLFAQAQGFGEVNPEATDWHPVFGG